MRRHPRLGYELVAGIEALQHAAEIIHSHHEHHDGNGYPRGLQGEDIPIGARIFSVVDSYDAMTSHRPYRRARSHQGTIDEIVRNSGTQFDPEAVHAFLKVERAGLIAPHDSPDARDAVAADGRVPTIGKSWDASGSS
jgi:HD-GYP domain-containing protein (c-di-GMP phosphodiesterase class II)